VQIYSSRRNSPDIKSRQSSRNCLGKLTMLFLLWLVLKNLSNYHGAIELTITARRYVSVSVTRRSIRQLSWYPLAGGPYNCPGARRVWRGFCHPGTNFNRRYACRGTNLISETDLSSCNKCYKMGTGAVSRYKLSRSQKFVKVQNFNCVQMSALPNVAERSWVSGGNGHYKFVLGVGAKAKSVTNNLPILSVLAHVILLD